MSKIDRYEIAATVLQPFIYERDMAGHDLPPIERPETTAQAAAELADEPHAHDLDDTTDDAVTIAVDQLMGELLAAIPTDRALDTSFVFDGNRIHSWRVRLAMDFIKAIDWQVGHADEAQTFAADELIAALRGSDGTEIGMQRIEDGERRVRQAERRATLWARARQAAAAKRAYPITPMMSPDGIAIAVRGACLRFQNLLGEPNRIFLAHRMLWALVRTMQRGMDNADRRLEKATSRQAIRDIKTQYRAYELLHDGLAEAYETATGGSTAPMDRREPEKVIHVAIADWLASSKARARYVA